LDGGVFYGEFRSDLLLNRGKNFLALIHVHIRDARVAAQCIMATT
jgi:hypothetical protein